MKRKRTESLPEEKQCRRKAPTTLLGLLEQAAAAWPEHGIRLCQTITESVGHFLSYPQLLEDAQV